MHRFIVKICIVTLLILPLLTFSGLKAQDQTHVDSMKAIIVRGKKAMFEQKTDRMVINVKNSISTAGGTALDILERSPGVRVDRQASSIAINGKSGVAVMINGKMSYLPADALVEFLAGLSTANIDKIELITAPPAKYDAGGNAGYINIVLVNNPYAGLSGSFFGTMGYGQRERGALGSDLNYRNGRLNLYGSYAFNHDHYIQTDAGFVQYVKRGNIITNSSYSDRNAIREVHNLRIGMDIQVDSATVIGALVSGYNNRWKMIASNGATVYRNFLPDTVIHTVDDPELNLWQNLMANLNFQHVFKPGRVLFIDANYIYYRDNNPNTYSTDYYNSSKELLHHEDQRSGKLTPIHFWVFSSDYTMPIGKRLTMETGAKLSLSTFTNDVYTENFIQGTWVGDPGLSAHYHLKENVAAAYSSFSLNLEGETTLTAGLRYEYTRSNLGSSGAANIIDKKYGELFPTLSVSKKFNGDNRLSFSYGRRITRPAFNDLAPFTIFFDPKTFFSGNPALQPAIAHSIQASYTYRNYSVTFSYTHELGLAAVGGTEHPEVGDPCVITDLVGEALEAQKKAEEDDKKNADKEPDDHSNTTTPVKDANVHDNMRFKRKGVVYYDRSIRQNIRRDSDSTGTLTDLPAKDTLH